LHYIILNGTHLTGKDGKKTEAVEEIFTSAGIQFKKLITHRRGDAKRFTEEVTSSGEKCTVVAMGGDGTLHDVINGFKNFDDCCMGIIPFGTGNDFASCAKIPTNAVKAAELIAYGKPRHIDFIELSSGLRSINSVGMGIDVDVLKRTYSGNKHGKGKYLRSLISSLIHFKSCNFTVRYDDKEEKHYGLIAACGNGKFLGGGINLFPEAKIDDGFLDLIIVDYISKPKIISAFVKLMRGKVAKVKNVTFVKTKAATFIHEDENYTIQAEGELYDNVPLEAKIVENKLKFYLP